jgi:hypothetical protein
VLRNLKKWLLEGFLPMWAKQTVLQENRRLTRQLRQLQQENEKLTSYIKGLHMGLRRKHENI